MDKKKKDYLSFTLICQFAICALLFGSLYGLKQINSGVYHSINNEFFSKINENTLIDFSKEIISDNGKSKTEESNPVNTSTADMMNEEAESESENTSTVEATETKGLSAEIKGEGGQDYSVDSIDEIPANVSVNSYVLNQRMFLPVKGETTSRFGVRNHPITNELKFHAGIDIAADSGTPIHSAFSGEVIVADYDKWNGYYLKIKHQGDIMTVYCHCQKLIVKKGDIVNAGDVIAYVGSSGSSTGPHLHFELRINNVSYDPETALKEAINGV